MKLSSPKPIVPNPYAKHPRTTTTLSIIAFVVYSACLYLAGIKSYTPMAESLVEMGASQRGLIKQAIKAPGPYFKSLSNAEPVERLMIDLKWEDFQKLKAERDEALRLGVLIQSKDPYVKAKIRYRDRQIETKMRLKGDWTDHLKGSKWSFRVHVKGSDHLFGVRYFSLQHPKVRGYQGEILFFEHLRREGVLVPRYFFVEVMVNGENVGLMAFEEHFGKELLESQSRKESVIVRFDETMFWDALRAHPDNAVSPIFDNYHNSRFKPFRSSEVAKSPKLSEDLRIATGLIRSFAQGRLPASDVFDAESLGRFFAVYELWGAHHGLRWPNVRFFFNPITAHLEPVGFDADTMNRSDASTPVCETEPWVVKALEDPAVRRVYLGTLARLRDEVAKGDLQKSLAKIDRKYIDILRLEFPLLKDFDLSHLKHRTQLFSDVSADNLDRMPRYDLPIKPTILHAYMIQDENGRRLQLGNMTPDPVRVDSIEWVIENKKTTTREEFASTDSVTLPIELPPTPLGGEPEFIELPYELSAHSGRLSIEIKATEVGAPNSRTYEIEAEEYYAPLAHNPILPTETGDAIADRYEFMDWDEDANKMTFKAGTWAIEEQIVFPRGAVIHVESGTTIEFSPQALLITHGAMVAEGTEEAPITFKGIGDEGRWQGIAVMHGETQSVWKHVRVFNTTGPSRLGWSITGAISFQQAPVTMDHCLFENNFTEDSLNIIRTEFTLNEVTIRNAASDAFDADFCKGTITGGLWEHVGHIGGGDGIDVSGSDILVDGTVLRDVNDKAISVGEGSKLEARNVKTIDCGVGAASKDGSVFKISNSTISHSKNSAFMCYIKKPEYGLNDVLADIEARSITLEGHEGVPVARAQTGCRVTIDGELVEAEPIDVKELYDTVMKKGMK